MKRTASTFLAAALLMASTGRLLAAVHYVDASSTNATPPYTNWATAATNIQDAVDAAVAGDEVVVTNGVYASGGRAVYGTMTNRVSVAKPLTLRSVNGPQFTTIQGRKPPGGDDGHGNGDGAIRCVYLTNGASLSGFTLTNGATRGHTGNYDQETCGGGLWGQSTNGVVVSNCVVAGNSAHDGGGGAWKCTLQNCTLAGNSAWVGGGAGDSRLNNCALTGNSTRDGGSGAYECTLNNCTLSSNSTTWIGGGAVSSILNNCTLTGNSAAQGGGGAVYCTLNKCTLAGNSGYEGGGAYTSTLTNCTLTGNSAGNGGGAYGGTLSNCRLSDNRATSSGGGAYGCFSYNCTLNANSAYAGGGAKYGNLYNCTVTDNSASSGGAGASGSGLYNCIVYFNRGTNYDSCFLYYCCTTPLATNGVGNISSDPQFASASHLSVDSPCRGAGNPDYAVGADIDGEPWANPPSIGCDEYVAGAITGALSIAISATYTYVGPSVPVDFTGLISGQASAIRWEFGDGTVISNRIYLSHSWTDPGDYVVTLSAYNESNPAGVGAALTIHVVDHPTHYVALGSTNPVAPYLSWTTAATNISEAVSVAAPGALLLVSNGVYSPFVVNKPLSIRSVNGAERTFVNGGAVAPCASLTEGVVLTGFSLTNGYASGGGGGARGGTLVNCTVSRNVGGGVFTSTLTNCTLSGNSGGGASGCSLNNCTLSDNSGGGAFDSRLNRCALTGNLGGAAYWSSLINCTVSHNVGGGVFTSTLTNCTLSGNSGAGLSYYSKANNCIVYFNTTAGESSNYDATCTLNSCCTTPLPANGVGNISSDPQLASASHLSAASPCRGAGDPAYASGADIDGEAWANPPSIGCDEYYAGAITGALSVAISANYTYVGPGVPVDFAGLVVGRASASRWEFGDGTVMSNQLYLSHGWTNPGDYAVVLRAYNESNPTGVSGALTIHVVAHPTHYAALGSTNATPPYTNWATAANNIPDAMIAAAPGATILVSTGVYAPLVVSKPLTIESANGAELTVIDGRTYSRCVSLTNGAVLTGFSLINGYTTYGGGSQGGTLNNCTFRGNSATSGGGAYQGTLNNCTLTGNFAFYDGGGAYGSTLNNCTLTHNSANGSGGGAANSSLNGCALAGNFAFYGGGGAYGGALTNCTLTGNSAPNSGGGAYGSLLMNCIAYYNTAATGPNYFFGTLNYCCTTPMPANTLGSNNITAEPQLIDSSHVGVNSPCRGAGNNSFTSGVDIDGEAWANPASIGCDEFYPGAASGALSVAIQADYTNVAAGFEVKFSAVITGHAASNQWNFADGTLVGGQIFAPHAWSAPGDYLVVLRAFNESNPGGVSAAVTLHVEAADRYVALTSLNPASPYLSWSNAAPTIQEAIDASPPGAVIWVSNGVYQAGQRVVPGNSTANRVAVTKPLTVRSYNGPAVTTIQGATNENGKVRCAYLTNGVTLDGFTLTGGASIYYENGGGVWCVSTSAIVANCVLLGNSANSGGGAFSGTLNNCTLAGNLAFNGGGGSYVSTLNLCTLTGNSANYGGGGAYCDLNNCSLTGNSAWNGGGVYEARLNNCALSGNVAKSSGGGAFLGTLTNCTLSANSAGDSGGGAYSCSLANCISYFNSASQGPNYESTSTLNYSCTTPLPGAGLGNISSDPQLASAVRLSAGSPCRGSGNAAYASGTDIDGEAWANPPAIGCDEYHADGLTGPLSVSITATFTNVVLGFAVQLAGQIEGRPTASIWDFGDGFAVTNQPYTSHAWAALGDYAVVLRAYNQSQPGGISATTIVHVVSQPVHYVSVDSANPVAPYTSWATAATNIQDAVDAATLPGALLLVTNGTYATGGRATVSDSTINRVAVDKPLNVRSVNGPQVTIIDGGGSGRGAYLATGAILSGFTLTNGPSGASGGTLNNCTLTGNSWGASRCALNNCLLSGNYTGAWGCILNNCTLTGNSGGAYASTLNNCISYFNTVQNYDGASTLNFCCSTPLPTKGVGNISLDPQLASASHLSGGSPCRFAGSAAYASGTDIDGEAWASPPSIGCDEYHSGSVTGPLTAGITATFTTVTVGFEVGLTALIQGRTTDSVWSFGDASIAINQPYTAHTWTAPGDYLVALWAFNETHPGGVIATVTVHVLEGVHYVAAASTNPVAPYTNWATAANNIQAAINAAVEPGAVVLVTNGTYYPINVHGLLTVRSVNGPQATTIMGFSGNRWTSGTRCAHLASGASLSGFTLTGGNGTYGGGVLCDSRDAIVSNCVIKDNGMAARDFSDDEGCQYGGGAYGGTLNNCTLSGNSVFTPYRFIGDNGYVAGGGAYDCTLNNCTLTGNTAVPDSYSRCAYWCYADGPVFCCQITTAYTRAYGGGAYSCTLNNSIILDGTADCNLNHCWTSDPLFVDTNGWANLRLQSNSPCINAGGNAYAAGSTDLDGRPRIVGGTVDIGAYEFQPGISGVFIGWLQQYGLPTGGSADFTDPDSDGVDNYHEWLAHTHPRDRFSSPAQLTLLPSGTNIVVTWPTNAVGFTLQSTTNLGSSAVWSSDSPAPAVIGEQNVVTNPVIGPQRFYRLLH